MSEICLHDYNTLIVIIIFFSKHSWCWYSYYVFNVANFQGFNRWMWMWGPEGHEASKLLEIKSLGSHTEQGVGEERSSQYKAFTMCTNENIWDMSSVIRKNVVFAWIFKGMMLHVISVSFRSLLMYEISPNEILNKQ